MDEVFNQEKELYLSFRKAVEYREIVSKIPEKKYLEMREEFKTKVHWGKEVQKCIDWLYDHGLKIITRGRLRNWMNKSIEIAKEQERRMLTRRADKQGGYNTKPRREPIWQPPV